MPRFDKTGPMGYGPMTGRGLGPCRWLGFSRRLTKTEETAETKEYIEELKREIKEAETRLKDLEK